MTKTMAQRIAERVVLGVCELPDYNSPEDQPDLVMCTVQQLEHCVLQAFEQLEYDREMERGPPVEPGASQSAEYDRALEAHAREMHPGVPIAPALKSSAPLSHIADCQCKNPWTDTFYEVGKCPLHGSRTTDG